jgi:hypothetical protein
MRGALTFAAVILAATAEAAFAQIVAAPRPTVPIILKPPPVAVKPLPMPIAPLAMTYTYQAVPQSGAPRQLGSVNAGSAWTCDQSGCMMTSPAAQPAVGGCNALAQRIGPIGSYGRNGAMLSPEQLDQCNHGIPGAIRMAAEAPAPVATPSTPPAEPLAEAAPAPSAIAGPAARFTIVSSELSVLGGAQGTVDPLPGRLSITSGELSVDGGAQGPRPTIQPPVSITVPELSVVGG